MLIRLNIKNFALIEEITVEFSEGFNILSGETGAGKSILIDAIDYVLGGKFSKDLIRTGEERTFVEAIFSIDNDNVNHVLDELGLKRWGRMLIRLNIKNFALIEEITVEFSEGFNILSGETGAGKSILIDAIDYVLGGKFSKDLIRTGEERTFVEAIFSIDNENVNHVLDELGIEYDDMLIISRETLLSGKSIIKVNGRSLRYSWAASKSKLITKK